MLSFFSDLALSIKRSVPAQNVKMKRNVLDVIFVAFRTPNVVQLNHVKLWPLDDHLLRNKNNFLIRLLKKKRAELFSKIKKGNWEAMPLSACKTIAKTRGQFQKNLGI